MEVPVSLKRDNIAPRYESLLLIRSELAFFEFPTRPRVNKGHDPFLARDFSFKDNHETLFGSFLRFDKEPAVFTKDELELLPTAGAVIRINSPQPLPLDIKCSRSLAEGTVFKPVF